MGCLLPVSSLNHRRATQLKWNDALKTARVLPPGWTERSGNQPIMTPAQNLRMALAAAIILVLDQLTKLAVLHHLGFSKEKVIIDGFFRFVHWGNTGAAWSMFRDNNDLLTIVALVALLVLFLTRHHFEIETPLGQIAMGMMFGGILGNLIDRMRIGHVVDFIYFYLNRRGGGEIGFPAFNVADSAICIGVGLLFLLSWRNEAVGKPKPTVAVKPE